MSPVMTPAYPSTAGDSARPSGVKARLTPKRPGRPVRNDEYAAFIRRILSAYSRRVADGDVGALIAMTSLADDLDTAIAEAVKGLRWQQVIAQQAPGHARRTCTIRLL